jgi:hypothetical protein
LSPYLDSCRDRARLILVVAVGVATVDQAIELIATVIQPHWLVKNATGPQLVFATLPLVFLYALVPFTPIVVIAAVDAGAALGNFVDAAFWPGGTPDFIHYRGHIFNGADALIYGCTPVLIVWTLFWLFWRLLLLLGREPPTTQPP